MLRNTLFIAFASLVVLAGCDDQVSSSDQKMRRQQEQLSNEAVMSVGMPAIVNFTEKRELKMLYELRDDPKLSTITYVRDINGKLHKLCDSFGYGIPYATQFTNPQKVEVHGTHNEGVAAIPQADPNGLFSPQTAEATWVMCLDPKSKKLSPIYVEDRLTVSQFELSSE